MPVSDGETLSRIQELVIPPAWRRVWISAHPRTHIQAVGVDAAGRRQYIYHRQWRSARDEEKYERVRQLAPCLPEFRARVADDLGGAGLTRERVLATGLRMLDRGVFRTGNEKYADENETFGVCTLMREHVRVEKGHIVFDYRAKGGIQRSLRIDDPLLGRAVCSLLRSRSGTDRLLVFRDRNDWHEVQADDINVRFKELVGDEFTVKDLRTWSATVLAAVALSEGEKPTSGRATKRAETAAMREVADHLGNTQAVARRSYVDPKIVDLFEKGVTVGPALRRLGNARLSDDDKRDKIERAVLRLLSRG
jgi:DNA topoisomerase IB